MTKDEVKKLWMDSPESLQFLNNATKFYNLMMMYRCAIREIQTKLEVLDDEFSVENNRNPISFIKTRIKQPNSIYDKLQKMGYEFTTENIQTYLNDVAGVRIVCAFIDDIYIISDLITQQDDLLEHRAAGQVSGAACLSHEKSASFLSFARRSRFLSIAHCLGGRHLKCKFFVNKGNRRHIIPRGAEKYKWHRRKKTAFSGNITGKRLFSWIQAPSSAPVRQNRSSRRHRCTSGSGRCHFRPGRPTGSGWYRPAGRCS